MGLLGSELLLHFSLRTQCVYMESLKMLHGDTNDLNNLLPITMTSSRYLICQRYSVDGSRCSTGLTGQGYFRGIIRPSNTRIPFTQEFSIQWNYIDCAYATRPWISQAIIECQNDRDGRYHSCIPSHYRPFWLITVLDASPSSPVVLSQVWNKIT